MPNEVFLRTRAGLSTMVSARAANRILVGALKGSGQNPDSVDHSQMRSALLGPVLSELEAVLPRDGLRRNLESLARSLREASGSEPERPRALLTGSITSETEAPVAVLDARASGWAPQSAEAIADPRDHEELFRADDVEGGAAPTPAPSSAVGPPGGPFEAFIAPSAGAAVAVDAAPATTRLERRLDDAELEEKLTRFALIENVRLVAAVRAGGEVPVVRGEGLDVDLLSRLSRLTLNLLNKGGKLRSLHLAHSRGQLFLFPVGPDLLVVHGGADLNIGAVTTAFTALALEEEL